MDCQVIVSLTSYPNRFKHPGFLKVLESLVNQQAIVKYKVVLNIHKDDMPYIPNSVKELVDKYGIEILEAPFNLKPHLKYFYVMKKYRDIPIITVDDDFIYVPTLVQKLLDEHVKYPGIIIASAAQPIKFDANGNTLPYASWRQDFHTDPTPSLDILPNGVGGVLYPPEFNKIVDDHMIDEIFEMSVLAKDDLYLHYVAAYQHSIKAKVVDTDAFIGWIPSNRQKLPNPFGQSIDEMGNNMDALWRTNECAYAGGNDGNQMSMHLFNLSNRR